MRIVSAILAIALGTVVALTVVSRGDTATPKTSSATYDSRCAVAWQAVRFYRGKVATHRHTLRVSDIPPVEQNADCPRLRERARYWRDTARSHAGVVRYHYDWRTWLPDNWRQLGVCETGWGGDPNFEHSNSRFTSAFGISWAEYNADAAYMGAPPWHVRHTPRDQYKAALGHYARFGDGWTCPGP
jgi:hypothetical protein